MRPDEIEPELVPVVADQYTGYLFRLATLLWSVPVSHGYGRRIRYLVRDRSNGKLIGIFALGDPVFNLSCRDAWIGWTVDDRRARLVNLMDAYVVGAVPPYSGLLGGKLVASLIGSAEVSRGFASKYGAATGIISGLQKRAQLALVTVTSALGRSSLYNRLRLRASADEGGEAPFLVNLERIGATKGFGHFQVSDELFERMRALLAAEGHPYANGHRYGDGPNWRLRIVRVGLTRLGLDDELTRHGITREVYAMAMSDMARAFLRGEVEDPEIDRPSVEEIGRAAVQRWIVPRAKLRPEFREFRREHLREMVAPDCAPLPRKGATLLPGMEAFG